MRMLITGTTSGFGRWLHQRFQDAETFNRGDALPDSSFDLVVHCAFDHTDHAANLKLTRHVLSIPCRRFVHLSSLDIYAAMRGNPSTYGITKLSCEQQVRALHDNYFILRLCALLGPGMRPNTLTRILNNESVSVRADSTFAYIRYEALLPYILSNYTGTYDVSGDVKPIKDIAAELGCCPEWGEFPYRTPQTRPVYSTMDQIREFMEHDFTSKPKQTPTA